MTDLDAKYAKSSASYVTFLHLLFGANDRQKYVNSI